MDRQEERAKRYSEFRAHLRFMLQYKKEATEEHVRRISADPFHELAWQAGPLLVLEVEIRQYKELLALVESAMTLDEFREVAEKLLESTKNQVLRRQRVCSSINPLSVAVREIKEEALRDFWFGSYGMENKLKELFWEEEYGRDAHGYIQAADQGSDHRGAPLC